MKWLEVIELRTTNQIKQDLLNALYEMVRKVREEFEHPQIKIYQSYSVYNDFCIHLIHVERPHANGSVLGIQISDSLKTHGFINHHIWYEMKDKGNVN